MKLTKLFSSGAKKIFSPDKPKPAPQKSVAQNLRGDWLKIGNDFRKVMNSYGRR